MEGFTMPSKDELKIMELSTIYKLRLIISQDTKEQYTKEEILSLLDTVALSKDWYSLQWLIFCNH